MSRSVQVATFSARALRSSARAGYEGALPGEEGSFVAQQPKLMERAKAHFIQEVWMRPAVMLPLLAVSCCLVVAALIRCYPDGRQSTGPAFANILQDMAVKRGGEEESGAQAEGPQPSLFCWSHLQPKSVETPLLRLQLVKRASIFACNNAAVISTKKMLLGNIDGIEVWTWSNPAQEVPMGQNGVDGSTTDSFLNTEIFLFAWDTLMNSKQIWDYDFTAKVDPDAVFFPDRLRDHVKEHVGRPVYFSNCGKYGGQVLLYGSLEVFSSQALKVYEKRINVCKDLPWHGWGEDYYMQHCMDELGVENVPDWSQVGDHRCVAAECSDNTKVAFHDFKDARTWYGCYLEATSA